MGRIFMSKTEALEAITRLHDLCANDPTRKSELMQFQMAFHSSFSNEHTRDNAVPFFQAMLQEWETTPPHANEELSADVSLLQKLVRTLQTRRRRKETAEENADAEKAAAAATHM